MADIVPYGPEAIIDGPRLGDPPRLAVGQFDPMVNEPLFPAVFPLGPQTGENPPEAVAIAPDANRRCRRHERPHVIGLVVANPGEPPSHSRDCVKGVEHTWRGQTRDAGPAGLPAAVEQHLSAAFLAHHHEAARGCEPDAAIRHRCVGHAHVQDAMH